MSSRSRRRRARWLRRRRHKDGRVVSQHHQAFLPFVSGGASVAGDFFQQPSRKSGSPATREWITTTEARVDLEDGRLAGVVHDGLKAQGAAGSLQHRPQSIRQPHDQWMTARDAFADLAGARFLAPMRDRAAERSALVEEHVDGELAADPVLLHEKIITEARGELNSARSRAMQMPIELLPAMGLRIRGQRQALGAGERPNGSGRGAGIPASVSNPAVAALSRAIRTTSPAETSPGFRSPRILLRVRENFQFRVDRWHEELHVFVSRYPEAAGRTPHPGSGGP